VFRVLEHLNHVVAGTKAKLFEGHFKRHSTCSAEASTNYFHESLHSITLIVIEILAWHLAPVRTGLLLKFVSQRTQCVEKPLVAFSDPSLEAENPVS
jgi:hypothetical protein